MQRRYSTAVLALFVGLCILNPIERDISLDLPGSKFLVVANHHHAAFGVSDLLPRGGAEHLYQIGIATVWSEVQRRTDEASAVRAKGVGADHLEFLARLSER